MSSSQRTLILDPKEIGQVGMYKLLIGGVIPRPIAWVSTISPQGISNLAPFSFFNAVSSSPACLSISIARNSKGEKKDTLKNIEATRQFVVNFSPRKLATLINQSAAEYSGDISEFQTLGIQEAASSKVRPPRVAKSPLAFECELYKHLEIGNGGQGSSTLVIGEIVAVQVREGVFENGKLILDELDPLSRLGGLSYGLTSGVFELSRPT